MSRKIYKKLVRDKIPEIIKKDGSIPKISILDETKYRQALKEKIIEEAKELLKTKTNEDILNELADLQELIHAIAKNHRISLEELEKERVKKRQKKGSFQKKVFLEYIDDSF